MHPLPPFLVGFIFWLKQDDITVYTKECAHTIFNFSPMIVLDVSSCFYLKI